MKIIGGILLCIMLLGCKDIMVENDDVMYHSSTFEGSEENIVRSYSEVEDALRGRNMLGIHKLGRLSMITGIEGSLRGDFFLGSGSISGSLTTTQSLMVAWYSAEDTIELSILPLNITSVVVSHIDTPTIRFKYNLNRILPRIGLNGNVIHWIQITPRTKILNDGVCAVTITMSEKDLEEGLYLRIFR